MLDSSQPSYYETTVAGKRVSDGKITTYYIDLNPWGTLAEKHEAKITQHEYERIERGDTVLVSQHAGYLAIPWIEVEL